MKSYFEIDGDGGSNVVEQVVEQRRRIGAALAGVRHQVAVGSGKGGVGKSTLTRYLAAALARRGRRIAILDADLNGPSQARLGGLRDTPLVPGAHGLELPAGRDGVRVASLGGIVPEQDAVDFDSVSSGDSHIWRATREFSFLGQLLGAVHWGELDLLLIDLPPGAERTFQYAEFLGPRTAFVLVTIPSELAHGVVQRSLSALGRTPNRILGFVENMSGYYCSSCDAVRPLFPGIHGPALAAPHLGSVPFDPALAGGSEIGAATDAAGASPALAAIDRTAARIVAALERDP